jgi:hypothetical protein
MNIFYVYRHITIDTKELFYIGKGKGRRAYDQNHNRLWKNIVEKHNYIIEFIKENLTEEEALRLEKELIDQYRPRANFSVGGRGGATGLKRSKEDIAKRSRTQSRQRSTPEARARQSLLSKEIASRPGMKEKAVEGRRPWLEKVKNGEVPNPWKGRVVSEETRKMISESQKGEKGYWYGKISGSAKKVIDLDTGEIFPSLKKAAESVGGSFRPMIRRMVIGKRYKKHLFAYYNKD